MKPVGKTVDGVVSVDGIFYFIDTIGLPPESVFDLVLEKGYAISWYHLICEALAGGWSMDTIEERFHAGIRDSSYWDRDERDLVCEKFTKLCHDMRGHLDIDLLARIQLRYAATK